MFRFQRVCPIRSPCPNSPNSVRKVDSASKVLNN